MSQPVVLAVCRSVSHTMSKAPCQQIRLIKGHGIEGDAHMGTTVKHRSRVAINAAQPNLRQVHLIHAELFDELQTKGIPVTPGHMGENITTRGIDLLALPRLTRLHLGATAIIEVTGLRNPCYQLDGLQQGLMEAVLERNLERGLIRKAGIMGIVIEGGDVFAADMIRIELPSGTHEALKPV